MMVDTYQTLLADLCRVIDVDLDQLSSSGRLVVEDTEMSLARETTDGVEYLWICIDFGAIPQEQASRVYRAMLQANLHWGGLDVGVFTLQSQGRAALVVRQPMTPALSGELLAGALLQYAAAGKEWIAKTCDAMREDHEAL